MPAGDTARRGRDENLLYVERAVRRMRRRDPIWMPRSVGITKLLK
jgi:hypothetical protein